MDSLEDLSRRQATTQNQLDPTRARPVPWFVGGGSRLTVVIVAIVSLLVAARAISTLWMAEMAWDWWTHRPVALSPAPVRIWAAPPEQPLLPGGTPASAKDDESAWIIPDDYPAESIRREEAGTTKMRWVIDIDGRVSSCGTVSSSGYPRLDDAACRAIMARGRYSPARDAGGLPIAITKQRTVRWQLPR